jgi:hypothetical protein
MKMKYAGYRLCACNSAVLFLHDSHIIFYLLSYIFGIQSPHSSLAAFAVYSKFLLLTHVFASTMLNLLFILYPLLFHLFLVLCFLSFNITSLTSKYVVLLHLLIIHLYTDPHYHTPCYVVYSQLIYICNTLFYHSSLYHQYLIC